MIAEVLVEINAKQIDQTFSYCIPENIKNKIKIGERVLVPFGKMKLEGFVLKIHNIIPDYKCKNIIELIDDEPVLTAEMIKLGDFISKKTMSTKISCYQTMLPKALKAHNGTTINKKYTVYTVLEGDILTLEKKVTSSKQKLILDLINKNKEILKSELTKISSSSYKTLLTKNIIKEIKKETYRFIDTNDFQEEEIILTKEQVNVIKHVKEKINEFVPFLLHGVTGSGKTEVYMQLISTVLEKKKQAIVLVPEISLTPQLTNKFKNRFGDEFAILHSGLSSGERFDEWRKIQKKEVSIVIGARSAVFAPFTNIGIIIVDEEHSSTYKQENHPRYNAIDVAIKRAQTYNCPIVLGSATPSIESYTRAKTNSYQLLEMKNRVNKTLPKVYTVDMKDEIKNKHIVFSRLLEEKIKDRLNKNEQIILLLNRRGYSTILSCHNCGYVMKCPHCDIPLVYHKTSNSMKCHYCGYSISKMYICPDCKSKEINEYGMGTQKLEEYTKNKFPTAKILRMDNDTMQKKGAHKNAIKAFMNHEYDILLGTQMIAKGLDFKDVTLVGVLNSDNTLNIPDFRSGERTFQLLNQVSGRAGRGTLKGEVVLQGFHMDHYSIMYAKTNDYLEFYKTEINLRKKLGYPPYKNLCIIRLKGKNQENLLKEGLKIQKYIIQNFTHNETVLGPNVSLIPKINDEYYVQLIIKYKVTEYIWKNLLFINDHYKKQNKISVEIDINPIKM